MSWFIAIFGITIMLLITVIIGIDIYLLNQKDIGDHKISLYTSTIVSVISIVMIILLTVLAYKYGKIAESCRKMTESIREANRTLKQSFTTDFTSF